jgi:hypothetical protein
MNVARLIRAGEDQSQLTRQAAPGSNNDGPQKRRRGNDQRHERYHLMILGKQAAGGDHPYQGIAQ